MKSFVDEQVDEVGYGTSSEYVRELIRKDQQRLQLRSLHIQGGLSAPAGQTRPTSMTCVRGYATRAERQIGPTANGEGENSRPARTGNRFIESALAYFLRDGAESAAVSFTDELESAYTHISWCPGYGLRPLRT